MIVSLPTVLEIRTMYVSQCYLNMAACYMKLEDYRSTVQYSTSVSMSILYRGRRASFAFYVKAIEMLSRFALWLVRNLSCPIRAQDVIYVLIVLT